MYSLAVSRSRMSAIQEFEEMRRQVFWRKLWANLTRHAITLLPFPTIAPHLPQPQVFRGVQDIPLTQIVGSVNRFREFDRWFLPLRNDTRERWVEMLLLAHTIGWEPIQVYQVGPLYFVEDGHHRVSVAQKLGNRSIEAVVWEFPVLLEVDRDASVEEIVAQLKRQDVSAYAS